MADFGDSNLIFVGGSPRSGTTLVQSILDSHSNIYGGPEFDYIPSIIGLRDSIHSGITSGRIDQYTSYSDVDRVSREFLIGLFQPLAKLQRVEYISEKTPSNILGFNQLIEVFPNAKFILVLRDPRAIIASMKQVRERALRKKVTPPHFVENVRQSMHYIWSCFTRGYECYKKHEDKVFIIKYEELVKNPKVVTKDITNYLGVEWEEQMLYPSKRVKFGNKLDYDNVWYTQEMYIRDIEKNELSKWKKQLSVIEQQMITETFKNHPLMKEFDYNLDLKIGKLYENLGNYQLKYYSLKEKLVYAKKEDKLNFDMDKFRGILKTLECKKIIGWGSGETYKKIQNKYKFELSYLVDSSLEKEGHQRNGLKIVNPIELLKENKEEIYILVFVQSPHQIYKWLDNKGFKKNKHFL
ncbi:hypothetical protein CVD28_09290 [Bacillus sp. M6-12]|uniref:sulfotransferase family protein n=1 Tax=Bacillus sp. M6-12 TaxID=2054166 RepID=UPI000C7835CF|nr:sulfotransferase [Bacillus sp. M6-12]PLS17877.1 hypothetical protein CVD28_09290 [Bacillus sp. M6-12]